jgi:hypothetical protein
VSFVVFLIAAIPAGIVAWVGIHTTSRAALWGAAIAAGLFGIVTGNPIYIGVDLLGVAIGLYIGHIEQTRLKRSRHEESPPSQPSPSRASTPTEKKDSGNFGWLIILIAVIAAYNSFVKPTTPRSTVQEQRDVTGSPSPSPVTPRRQPLSDVPHQKMQSTAPAAFSEPYPTPTKSNPATNGSRRNDQAQSRSHKDSAESQQKAAYRIALRQIEERHPELNQDSTAYRADLVEQAVRLKNGYLAKGYALDEALLQAVSLMEKNSVFSVQAREIAAPVMEPDSGGHTGFDPKCRWVTAQDWTCK